MTAQLFHNRIGNIPLLQVDADSRPKTSLCLISSKKADVFLGTIKVHEFSSSDDPLYLYEYYLQPAVDLTIRDESAYMSMLVMVAGTISFCFPGSVKWNLSEGQHFIFRSAEYTISLPENARVRYFIFDLNRVTKRMNWPDFIEGRYDLSAIMKLTLASLLDPPGPLDLPIDWLTLQQITLLYQQRLLEQQDKLDGKKNPSLELARAIDAYLQANFTQNFNIKHIARSIGSNDCSMKKAFSEHYNMGILERKNEYRVKLAMKQLLETKKSIIEITMDCGYDSPTSLRDNFRFITKLNPLEWRKKHKL